MKVILPEKLTDDELNNLPAYSEFRYWGLSEQDLRKVDLTNLTSLEKITFDSDTKFSEEDEKRLEPKK